MRAFLLSILFVMSTAALASDGCTHSTVTQADGKMQFCTTCCSAGVCSTQCF